MINIKEKIQKIHSFSFEDAKECEKLILELGLNNEILNEQPTEFQAYYGHGLKMWQYPNQLSKFALALNKIKINSYMEIGCRFGGTFVFISEILKKNNNFLKNYACDIIEKSDILKEYSENVDFKYFKMSSREQDFKDMCAQIKPEFVFIDGDHSYEGVKNDFLIFENMLETKFIAFHDITNDVCPGVVQIWDEVKKDNRFETQEFTEQYESVKGNFLGIGLAIRK
jgi:cephalosporin hydroxylase